MPTVTKTELGAALRELLRRGQVEWLSIRDGGESDLIVVGIRMSAEVGLQEVSAEDLGHQTDLGRGGDRL